MCCVDLVYYTGTGSTALVADQLKRAFSEKGVGVYCHQLRHDAMVFEPTGDLLLVIFPVHACNAPELIYRWIKETGQKDHAPVAVISVSGGGDITPNTACRISTIKKLKKKGYDLVYEAMVVMPSNWIVPTPMPVAKKLLTVLPFKAQNIVDDILLKRSIVKKPHFLDRVLSMIGELEKWGAKGFGAHFKVRNTCTNCGWCETACPAGNISCSNGPPVFKNQCQLCLNCVYGCPHKALEPTRSRFVIIKEGFSIKAIEKSTHDASQEIIEGLTQGFLWSGVRKYLKSLKA